MSKTLRFQEDADFLRIVCFIYKKQSILTFQQFADILIRYLLDLIHTVVTGSWILGKLVTFSLEVAALCIQIYNVLDICI